MISLVAGDMRAQADEPHVFLVLSQQWYCIDFGGNERERLEWILPRLPAKRGEALRALLAGA